MQGLTTLIFYSSLGVYNYVFTQICSLFQYYGFKIQA